MCVKEYDDMSLTDFIYEDEKIYIYKYISR